MSAYTDADVEAAVGLGRAHGALNTMFDGWLCACGYKTRTDEEIDAHQVRTILNAVAPAIAARAQAEALRELSNRLFRADVELSRMKHQLERITGKAEGVRLARSYVEETIRAIENEVKA